MGERDEAAVFESVCYFLGHRVLIKLHLLLQNPLTDLADPLKNIPLPFQSPPLSPARLKRSPPHPPPPHSHLDPINLPSPDSIADVEVVVEQLFCEGNVLVRDEAGLLEQGEEQVRGGLGQAVQPG